MIIIGSRKMISSLDELTTPVWSTRCKCQSLSIVLSICVQGLIYVIGGENIDTVEFFDGDKWTLGPSLPLKIQYVQVVYKIKFSKLLFAL